MPFENTGGAKRVISLGSNGYPAGAVRAREFCRFADPDQLRRRLHSVFNEDAGWVAVRVLLDGELRDRRDRIAGDARTLQRFRVRAGNERRRAAPKTPDRPDEHGILWSRGIQLL